MTNGIARRMAPRQSMFAYGRVAVTYVTGAAYDANVIGTANARITRKLLKSAAPLCNGLRTIPSNGRLERPD